MGQQASVPVPGTRLQVIGAGLSRTGTASLSEALRILLDGPIYHGGTQVTMGPEVEVTSWIKILRLWNQQQHHTGRGAGGGGGGDNNKRVMMELLERRLNGYAAITDTPGTQFVPELMELYPDAKLICTVRDPVSWEKSMEQLSNAATKWFLRFVLFPLPGMRYVVDYFNALQDQWDALYDERDPPTRKTYDRHIAWLKEVVPEDRLVFFDVKDGWEPLCRALGKEVPKDIPFPRINDGEAIDRIAKMHIQRGLTRWAGIFTAVGIAAVAAYVMRR